MNRKNTIDIAIVISCIMGMHNRERYFGFPFHKGQEEEEAQASVKGGEKRNLLDVTEMVDAFIEIK